MLVNRVQSNNYNTNFGMAVKYSVTPKNVQKYLAKLGSKDFANANKIIKELDELPVETTLSLVEHDSRKTYQLLKVTVGEKSYTDGTNVFTYNPLNTLKKALKEAHKQHRKMVLEG